MKRDYTNLQADVWYQNMLENLENVPFSFLYNGVEYNGFSSKYFTVSKREVKKCNEKETNTIIFSFADGLAVTLVLTHYYSHGATEWTVWFENVSKGNTGIIKSPKTKLTFSGEYPVLKGIWGDHVNQYRPYSIDMTDNIVTFTSNEGRPTHIQFPYFNLEYGKQGVMLAIGWGGSWTACFSADDENITYTATSVNDWEFYLKPGEKVRTALFVVAPYQIRNEHYATNYWRSWYVKHNLPKADANGTDLQPFITCCLQGKADKSSVEKLLAEDIIPDIRWIDAGWYTTQSGGSWDGSWWENDWWSNVGSWELDHVKWPQNDFYDAVDFAHENGIKTMLWFEPERVNRVDDLVKYFNYDASWAIYGGTNPVIANNIGNPKCYKWTLERICKMLSENKVDIYREDVNCDPRYLWVIQDGEEEGTRLGITEAKCVLAHYQLWDDVIACTTSYGGAAFVDSCAGGGGRNDLESMRRGVPLLRSDSDRTFSSLRLSMTSSFCKWLPFCGAHIKEKEVEETAYGNCDKYIFRASYLPSLNVATSVFPDAGEEEYETIRKGIQEWKRVAPYLLKEFYLLTPWHSEKDKTDNTVFCYFDPETEKGVLLAFRQEDSVMWKKTLRVILPFIEKGQKYLLIDEDSGEKYIVEKELELYFETLRTSRLLWIERIK